MKNFQYILTHSSGNLTLEYNPLEWNSFNMVFSRSEKYHSVLRSQIVDSEFPFDGKAYIDSIYETYGIDTEIGCEIKYLNKLTETYITLFTGIIDLSKWSNLRDTTTVSIIDSSVMAKFMARDEVLIPINRTTDLDGDAVSVYSYLADMTVEGVNIEEKAEFDDVTNSITINTAEPGPGIFNHYHGVSDEDYDFNTIGDDAVLPDEDIGSPTGVVYTNTSGFPVDVRYRIKTRAVGSVTGSGTWAARAHVGPTGSVVTVIDESGAGFDASFDSGDTEVTLADTESIFLYHRWSGDGAVNPSFSFLPILVEVSEIIPAQPETEVSMPLMHELGAKLLEIMTGVSNPLNSALLGRTDSEPRTYGSDGDYSLIGGASGLMLRSYRSTQFPFQTTFADFFKSIDALFNLGLWYNGTEFSISDKEDFYRDDKVITLGEVSELEISISKEDYFNKILTGYKTKVEYDESNGQQVPNVPGEFSNAGQRISGTLDLQSIYRGDDYGIELSRQSPFRSTASEDTKFDEDNFFIVGQRDAGDYRTLQGYDNFTVIDGIYSPATRLNLDITPKRNLLRQLNRLSVPLFKSLGDTLFMKTQFNLDLSTQKSGDPAIDELDDIAFTEEPLYYPELYTFNAELDFSIILQLLSDPHGYVDFDYLGVTYSGYILEVSSQPFNRRGNWTLVKRNPNR